MIGALFTPLVNGGFAALYALPAQNVSLTTIGRFLGIPIQLGNLHTNWLTSGLVVLDNAGNPKGLGTPHGSIFGIMLAGIIAIHAEKLIGRIVPGILSAVVTPFLTLFLIVVAGFLIVFPLSGYLFLAVTWFFSVLSSSPFGAMILAGIFLLVVTFGIHQGFVPIYIALIGQTGINSLFPILAMAGAAQVGTALALWFIAEKKGVLRGQIQAAIIPGFLGIGEPLIYGVTLPRVIPFVSSGIAAMIPGFFIGAINTWGGINMGLNAAFGPSGLLSIPMITSTTKGTEAGVAVYLSGLVLGYAAGFLLLLGAYVLFKKNKHVN